VPELPEIEALRETLATRLIGKAIISAQSRQFALVKTYDPPLEALIDERVEDTDRHGKHLIIFIGDDHTMVIHLGIGGRIVLADASKKPSRAVSLEIRMEDGVSVQVVELGTKKRSSVHLLRRADLKEHLSRQGPDALSSELSVERFAELVRAERMQLKSFLTDQHRVAGIGNAYSDEILWEAKLAPLHMTTSLEDDEIERLHAAIGLVLPQALEQARSDNYLLVARGDKRGHFKVHRREREACPRCGEPIASIHYAESSLQYCPACQEGRHYADRRLSRLLK